MASSYDFVIFGGSPLAALISGLLAHDHGAKVLRVADPPSKMRLSRSIDVALPFATRPATWRMLRAGIAETARLLAETGGGDRLDRVDVKLISDLPDSAAALAHMTHVAASYGFPSVAALFRDVPRFSGEIDMADSAVQTVESNRVALEAGLQGAALRVDGETMPAGQIVLADDAAILANLPESERPRVLRTVSMLATLTHPTRRLPATVMRYVDRGVSLAQREDRSILALVDAGAEAETRLGSCLPGPFPLPRRATTHYRRLAAADGAPLVGMAEASRLTLIAGLGSAAAFLAPPLARCLAGHGSDEEKAWFGTHGPASEARAAVADLPEVHHEA